MRIVQITPGTGDFYCGVCLRDRALARALRARGHDVLMIPMYLPHVTDDEDGPPPTPIFYGGINVYLQQKSALFRHTPAWFDRLFNAPGLLRLAARGAGWTSARDLGELTLSTLRGAEGRQAKEVEKLIAWLRTQPAPDVICLASVLLVGLARRLRATFGVPLFATLQGEDCFLDSLPAPYRDQAWNLVADRCADLRRLIAPSQYYADLMQRRLRLPPDRVVVIPNGIDLADLTPATVPPTPPVIGFLARMHPSKGLATLVDAFIELKQRNRVMDLRLHIAGAETAADRPFVRVQQQKLDAHGLTAMVQFHPNLDRAAKAQFLRGLTVFTVPATYGESFGLYILESLACGVPVVQPRHAAFPEILAATGGGILCAPDDPQSLADALESLLLDPAKARQLGAQGRTAVAEKFSAAVMAGRVEDALRMAGR